ncbi:MAG: Synechococcus phage [Bacteroidota bacterium]
MSFFESDIVKAELKEIGHLQEKIASNVISFGSMSKEIKLEHIKTLESLLEKQKVLYTRLSLSDDPDAIDMKQKLNESVKIIGIDSKSDINQVFSNITTLIKTIKMQLQDD